MSSFVKKLKNIAVQKLKMQTSSLRLALLDYITPMGEKKTDNFEVRAAIGADMKAMAQEYDYAKVYFDNTHSPHLFMKSFVALTHDKILKYEDRSARIYDACGGPGNLGIGLGLQGYNNYLLMDIDVPRMRWGALLAKKYGIALEWEKGNVLRTGHADQSFDAVTLLGWEASFLPYSWTLKEMTRIVKMGGRIYFTYHDIEGIIEGNWDFDTTRSYSFLPYSISQTSLEKLCDRLGLKILENVLVEKPAELYNFFPDGRARVFPQYLMVCQRVRELPNGIS